MQAEEYQKRAARVGFDWANVQGVIDKICEEVEELRSAEGAAEQEAELGDLLFAVVNLARWMKVDAESALRETNARFKRRFAVVEQGAEATGRKVSDLSLEEMDELVGEGEKGESRVEGGAKGGGQIVCGAFNSRSPTPTGSLQAVAGVHFGSDGDLAQCDRRVIHLS